MFTCLESVSVTGGDCGSDLVFLVLTGRVGVLLSSLVSFIDQSRRNKVYGAGSTVFGDGWEGRRAVLPAVGAQGHEDAGGPRWSQPGLSDSATTILAQLVL